VQEQLFETQLVEVVWLCTLAVLILPGLFSGPSNSLALVVQFDLFFLVVSGLLAVASSALDDQLGQQFVYLLLAVVAAEAALGLSVLLAHRRRGGTGVLYDIGGLKG
jgi:NADH:ubiquinone oxidoreductase subunit K